VKWGLGPAEFFAGIPGTLGGALAMNAGAWGGETWRHVLEVEVLDRHGARRTRTPADYEVGYRRVVGPPGEWFLGAQLEFERKPGVNESAMRELLDKRPGSSKARGSRAFASAMPRYRGSTRISSSTTAPPGPPTSRR
jgi:UDP-N-acetylmuramate dehydrogenase